MLSLPIQSELIRKSYCNCILMFLLQALHITSEKILTKDTPHHSPNTSELRQPHKAMGALSFNLPVCLNGMSMKYYLFM